MEEIKNKWQTYLLVILLSGGTSNLPELFKSDKGGNLENFKQGEYQRNIEDLYELEWENYNRLKKQIIQHDCTTD